jgi:hypothetical protein
LAESPNSFAADPTVTLRNSLNSTAVLQVDQPIPVRPAPPPAEAPRLKILRDLWSGTSRRSSADPSHRAHLEPAIRWLAAAQDSSPDSGIARGFSLKFSPYFGKRGWQPSYPETTGYIIPTLYGAARALDEPALADRATRAARWEVAVQLVSGAVQGGVITDNPSPAIFNTGQVMLGWLSALEETGDAVFADAAIQAGEYMTYVQEPDGHWRKGNSRFARGDTTLYNARAAWALAEAGARLEKPHFLDAARKNLRAVAEQQHDNGWFPNCCLYQPQKPLLHTVAYTIRGLIEGGRVLNDENLIASGAQAASRLVRVVREDGFMPGQLASDWSAGSRWSCLTGEAQMANNWMRLHAITGDAKWLEPVEHVLDYLKRTQDRSASEMGVRGGIRGSEPVAGEYGAFEILSWATKFFADALMRHSALLEGLPQAPVSDLA